jgi:GMP synthase-like glutamine amidotransferase/DNA-binding CsgD family transcriptional regulator
LALEHLRPNPVGIYGRVLEERGIAVDRVSVDEGERVPDWRRYDLIVAMGAGHSVWQDDEFPWIAEEKRLVREAVLAGMPYFGVCFGAQILADAFGGRGFRGPEPELGVNQVFLTAAARRDPVFRGFPADLEVCQWHANHFSLPPGAVRLARSPRYENQAIRYGRVAYGIQCHLETTAEDLREWLRCFPDTVPTFNARHGAGSIDGFLDDYAAFVPSLQETGRQLFGRWLENALALGGLGGTARAVRLHHAAGGEDSAAFVGRGAELARIDAALASARRGESSVLVIRGEGGVGKTALLDAAADRARGLHILRTRGDDPDGEEPFAAMAELCRPLADGIGALSPPRAVAVAAILEPLADGRLGDRYAAYAGALDLLVRAAEETPLLVLVDEAHLLDDASSEAVAFLSRRLGADGIALLVATESEDDLPDAEDLRLGGLAPPDARAVLDARWGEDLDPQVSDLVVAAAVGNPLALLEIPLDLTADQRAGRATIDDALPASAEWAFLRRLDRLSRHARQALLVAALARRSELQAIEPACAGLGISRSALEAGAEAGFIRLDGGDVAFRHELARTAVAYSALRADRRSAHAALAGSLTGDARTWHLARAATGPDEPVAVELERIAVRARDRGAFAAAARALELAARLTSDADARAQRLLAAADAAHLAGHVNAALTHLGAVAACAPSRSVRRDAEHLRGRIVRRSGSAISARDTLLASASGWEQAEPATAAQMLADAVLPALRAGDPSEAVRIARRAARLTRDRHDQVALSATVALGTALIFAGDYAEGASLIDTAADDAAPAVDAQLRASLGAGLVLAGRHAQAHTLLTTLIDEARTAGALSVLPYALLRLGDVQLETGAWSAAASGLYEAAQLAEQTGQAADRGLALGALAWLDAARGRDEECEAHVEEALELAGRLGGGSRLDRAAMARGLLHLGRGRAEPAIAELEAACRLQDEQGWSDAARTPHRRPDLIEAYALAGRIEDAREALDRFGRDAERAGRPSALAAAARCRGLLADDAELDEAFAQALSAPPDTVGPFERARTELLHGSRLAERGRLDQARPPLMRALATFERLGAEPWSQRARMSIMITGASPPTPRLSPMERLTPRELEVALAATGGMSAREIAERLFLGPRTVELHLAKAAIKLGLESPAELASVLRTDAPAEALQPSVTPP